MAALLVLLWALSTTGCPLIGIKPSVTGELAALVSNQSGRVIAKWAHYLPLYELHFQHLRPQAVTMLEIGVSGAGDMALWNQYFRSVHVHGVDLDPKAKALECSYLTVHTASETNSSHLHRLADRHAPFDIVLDDGSHLAQHMLAGFNVLFPALQEGGLYWVEDLARPDQALAARHIFMQSLDDNSVHIHPQVMVIQKGRRRTTSALPMEIGGLDYFSHRFSNIILAGSGVRPCWSRLFRGRVRRTDGEPQLLLRPKAYNVLVLAAHDFTAALADHLVAQHTTGTVFAVGRSPCRTMRSVLLGLLPLLLTGSEPLAPKPISAIHCLSNLAVIHLRRHVPMQMVVRPQMPVTAIAQFVAARVEEGNYPC